MSTDRTKRVHIYPYNSASQGARLLSEALGIKRIKHSNSNYRDAEDKLIINYGSSYIPYVNSWIINNPEAISIASNKELTFNKIFTVVQIPRYTTDVSIAKSWDCDKVVARSTVTGCQGRGIQVYEFDVFKDMSNENLSQYVFFSEYIKKTREVRVHVVDGKAILVQAKKLTRYSTDIPDRFLIRNHHNGWVFSSNHGLDNDVVSMLESEAIKAVTKVGLDFGAVDMIYNQVKGVYVLEINTAPGLSDASLPAYTEAFNKILGDI